MLFDLPPSFLTDIAQLDSEHRALVAQINSVAELERVRDKNGVLAALAHFMVDLGEHFRGEEALFDRLGYPKLVEHAHHHTETMTALGRLVRDIESGELATSSATHTCLHELLSSIIRVDKEFTNWLAVNPTARKKAAERSEGAIAALEPSAVDAASQGGEARPKHCEAGPIDVMSSAGREVTRPIVTRLLDRHSSRQGRVMRNLVERFFNKLKHFKRIATRFDKLARNFLAAAALASARLWTRTYESTT
jgi:hemerythrin-like metal-binding protein